MAGIKNALYPMQLQLSGPNATYLKLSDMSIICQLICLLSDNAIATDRSIVSNNALATDRSTIK